MKASQKTQIGQVNSIGSRKELLYMRKHLKVHRLSVICELRFSFSLVFVGLFSYLNYIYICLIC